MSGRFGDEREGSGVVTSRFDDEPFTLEDAVVDQILGAAADDRVPATYRRVIDVLAAARAPATEAELVGEAAAVDLFRLGRPAAGTAGKPSPVRRVGVKALLAAGALTLATATGAAATTGNLPERAQAIAATVLSKVGISVPEASPDSPDQPATTKPSDVGRSRSTAPAKRNEAGNETPPNDVATSAPTTRIDDPIAVSPAGTEQPSSSPVDPSLPAPPDQSAAPPTETPTSTPAEPPLSTPAGPPSSVPVESPPSTPADPPSTPADPPSTSPSGRASSTPEGRPSSPPSGPPSSVPGRAPSSVPGDRAASVPGPESSPSSAPETVPTPSERGADDKGPSG